MNQQRENSIRIVGARTHNLKNVAVEIPRDQVVVITGPSGCGKSSLAIDTLSAEAQRQYFNSLSLHARQFFKQLPVAEVDSIEGLPPTIFVDQATGNRNRRSTVGTLTEIHDYLRLLFARCGTLHCYQCEQPILQHTAPEIRRWVDQLPDRTKIIILAPLDNARTGDLKTAIERVRKERLVRVRIEGKIYDIDQIPLAQTGPTEIAAVTDRLVVGSDLGPRLQEAISLADQLSRGRVIVCFERPSSQSASDAPEWIDQVFSTRYACPTCQIGYDEVLPSTFSFNSPSGACIDCHGLGEFDHQPRSENQSEATPKKLKRKTNPSAATEPAASLSEESQADSPGNDELETLINRANIVLPAQVCATCGGSRLSQHALAVRLNGKNLGQLVSLSIREAIEFFEHFQVHTDRQPVATPLVENVLTRLQFLDRVGVGYLNLGRGVNTLSGGEHQRIRLASSLGSGLTNVCYVVDEPTVGLHPRDTDRLIQTIRDLRDAGNSVVMIEHDEPSIRSADFVIDMGPAAGRCGGSVVAVGSPQEIEQNPQSLTGQFLSRQHSVGSIRPNRPVRQDAMLGIVGAAGRNLKRVDLQVPLGVFVAVTGVSGSGKSSLINQTLVPAVVNSLRLRQRSPHPPLPVLPFERIEGAENIDSLVVVDQRPMSLSTRGCPVTVLGIFDTIRKIFAATKKAKQLGFPASRFSFSAKSGWCPECRGLGQKKIEMNFVPDFSVPCSVCRGRRFNLQTLQVTFNEQSIANVLEMSVERAREFFDGFESLARPLQRMLDVGLGYLQLGQSTVTLSGGESQRLKLAAELATKTGQHTLYVLDEPTTGLHFRDIQTLMKAMNLLVENGNSLIVIEHNLDVIRHVDWVIDIGPEGGAKGGEILFCGPPEELKIASRSFTAKYLI